MLQEKLKESQYQITPWRAESSNYTSAAAQSPSHTPGNALVCSIWHYACFSSYISWNACMIVDANVHHISQSKANLDIVPQQAYSHVQSPASSPVRARRDWDLLGNENHQVIRSDVATTSAEHDNVGRTSPSTRLLVVTLKIQ